MKLLKTRTLAIAAIQLLSWTGAQATNLVRVETKKVLSVQEGRYVVTNAKSVSDDENFCVKGAIHSVAWSGPESSPLLSFGNARLYDQFNAGPVSASEPSDPDECAFRQNTMAESHRMIQESFTNCRSANTRVHTEITFGDALIHYVAFKIARGGKVVEAVTSCDLRRIRPLRSKNKVELVD